MFDVLIDARAFEAPLCKRARNCLTSIAAISSRAADLLRNTARIILLLPSRCAVCVCARARAFIARKILQTGKWIDISPQGRRRPFAFRSVLPHADATCFKPNTSYARTRPLRRSPPRFEIIFPAPRTFIRLSRRLIVTIGPVVVASLLMHLSIRVVYTTMIRAHSRVARAMIRASPPPPRSQS